MRIDLTLPNMQKLVKPKCSIQNTSSIIRHFCYHNLSTRSFINGSVFTKPASTLAVEAVKPSIALGNNNCLSIIWPVPPWRNSSRSMWSFVPIVCVVKSMSLKVIDLWFVFKRYLDWDSIVSGSLSLSTSCMDSYFLCFSLYNLSGKTWKTNQHVYQNMYPLSPNIRVPDLSSNKSSHQEARSLSIGYGAKYAWWILDEVRNQTLHFVASF